MTRQDKEQVLKALVAMAENFNRELSKAHLGMILTTLEPYPLETVNAALTALLRTHRGGFPTVADFINAIEGTPDENKRLAAEADWQALWVAERRGAWQTFYGEPDPPGPEHYLSPTGLLTFRQLGGRQAMLTWLTADLHWRKREFIELHMQLSGNEQKFLELAGNTGCLPVPGLKALVAKVGRAMSYGQKGN